MVYDFILNSVTGRYIHCFKISRVTTYTISMYRRFYNHQILFSRFMQVIGVVLNVPVACIIIGRL